MNLRFLSLLIYHIVFSAQMVFDCKSDEENKHKTYYDFKRCKWFLVWTVLLLEALVCLWLNFKAIFQSSFFKYGIFQLLGKFAYFLFEVINLTWILLDCSIWQRKIMIKSLGVFTLYTYRFIPSSWYILLCIQNIISEKQIWRSVISYAISAFQTAAGSSWKFVLYLAIEVYHLLWGYWIIVRQFEEGVCPFFWFALFIT